MIDIEGIYKDAVETVNGLCEKYGDNAFWGVILTKAKDMLEAGVDPITKILKVLVKMFIMQLITSMSGQMLENVQEKVKEVKNKIQEIKRKIEKIKKLIKKIIEFFKKFIKAANKLIQTLAKIFFTFPPSWVSWAILLICIILIFLSLLFSRFGSFKGEFVIDLDKMQSMNQDEDEYTDLLNTGALKEAFYQSVSDTSFYQTFNLTDMDGAEIPLINTVIADLASSLTNGKVEATATDILASQKCTTPGTASCVYANGALMEVFTYVGVYVPQLDKRNPIRDANQNPAKYLIQAESLGTYSDSFGFTSYFRDYWNREESFQLSKDFLYELNRWMYDNDKYPTTEQIIYPEAFVKPVSFVQDFLRIDTDKNSKTFGQAYVYVTERVTLDDINNADSLYYERYDLEGIIKSLPSDIVYDYVIAATNDYRVEEQTNSANQVNIGNVSQYVTVQGSVVYDDGSTEATETLMRMYWVVNPLFKDYHMGVDITYQNMFSYVNDGYVNQTGYYYRNANGEIEDVVSTEAAFIGPFIGIDTYEYTQNGRIVFLAQCNEYWVGGGEVASIGDDDRKNLSFVYKQTNPNLKNGAFVVNGDGSNYTFVNCVVDYEKSFGKGQVLKAGDAVYYRGNYYLVSSGTHALDTTSPTSFTKCSAFIQIPHLVYYKKGVTVYPGEIVVIDKYWEGDGTTRISELKNFGFLDKQSADKEKYHAWANKELNTFEIPIYLLKLFGGVTNVKGKMYHTQGMFVYNGKSAATLNADFVNKNLKVTDSIIDRDNSTFKPIDTMDDTNLLPRKHYQLTQLSDESGEIVSSSRNLINKLYLKTRTVRSYYRNSDEYWSKFAEFILMDTERMKYVGAVSNFFNVGTEEDCYFVGEEGNANFDGLVYKEFGEIKYDSENDWSTKKCSVIYYVNQKYVGQDFVTKIINFAKGDDAQFEEIEGSAEGIFSILLLYEEYLTDVGTEGVEWEYKYYTNSEDDLQAAYRDFKPQWDVLGIIKIPSVTGLATYFETDKHKYKDTFNTVVELNSARSISSEYTPIAVVSGTEAEVYKLTCSSCHKTYYKTSQAVWCSTCLTIVKLDVGAPVTGVWGWRLVLDASGNPTTNLKRVYGESSLEIPEYYNAADISSEVMSRQLIEALDWLEHNGILLGGTPGTSIATKVAKGLCGFLFNTDYADNVYGAVNFAYKWDGTAGQKILKYDSQSLQDFWTTTYLHATTLPELDDSAGGDDDYQDIRNGTEAWNADTVVYRPATTGYNSGVMVSCKVTNDNRGCGRVTTKNYEEDYLAMELKSVRDYGLASVLSYLEGRKVTFFTGLAISETYDVNGVYAWMYSYYSSNKANFYFDTTTILDGQMIDTMAKMAMQGYFASELLDDSIKVKLIICPYCGKDPDSWSLSCNHKFDYNTAVPFSRFAKSTDIFDEDGYFKGKNSEFNVHEIFTAADLANIADGLNELQGTGNSILKYTTNGTEYWFTATYALDVNDVNTNQNDVLKKSQGYILMIKKIQDTDGDGETADDSKWIKTNVNIAIPYLTESGLRWFADLQLTAKNIMTNVEAAWDGKACPECGGTLILGVCGNCKLEWMTAYTDQMARDEASNQFFNPKGYYLAWYDYATGNLDLQDHLTSFLVTRKEVITYYDNNTALALRKLFNSNEACDECSCKEQRGHANDCQCETPVDEPITMTEFVNVKGDGLCDSCGKPRMVAIDSVDSPIAGSGGGTLVPGSGGDIRPFIAVPVDPYAGYEYCTCRTFVDNNIVRKEQTTTIPPDGICDVCNKYIITCDQPLDENDDGICDTCWHDLCACGCHGIYHNLEGIADVKSRFWSRTDLLEWLAELLNVGNVFDGAGRYTTDAVYKDLYNKYYEHVNRINLLDETRTSNVFMIEEAVTFLGNFVYTYDTDMFLAGDIYGNEKIVSDLIFADRGYVLSNYIFSVPSYTTQVMWEPQKEEAEQTIAGYNGNISSYVNNIYNSNPCFKFEDKAATQNWAQNAVDWVKDKGRNFLVFIAGALNIATESELEEADIVDPAVLRDGNGEPYGYCAANFSYYEEIYYKYTYDYVYTSNVTVLENLVDCTERDTSNGGKNAGTKTTCESYLVYPPASGGTGSGSGSGSSGTGTGNGGRAIHLQGGLGGDGYWGDDMMQCYLDEDNKKVCIPAGGGSKPVTPKPDPEPETRYKETTITYTRVKYTSYKQPSNLPLYNNQWVGDVYYISTVRELDTDNSILHYRWYWKWGYSYSINTLDFNSAIYIDTYDEVTRVYKELQNKGKNSTANKLFIGMQVYANLNDFGWFGALDNNIDLQAAHFYTAVRYRVCLGCWRKNPAGVKECTVCGSLVLSAPISTGTMDTSKNTLDQEAYDSWCIRQSGTSKCLAASYGDTERHYLPYSYEYLANLGESGSLISKMSSALAFLDGLFDLKKDVKTNLKGRYGVLLGEGRVDSYGNLRNNKTWWLGSGSVTYDSYGLPHYDVLVDDNGNLDEYLVSVSNDYVRFGYDQTATIDDWFTSYNFDLSVDDLTNISQAIYNIFSDSYRGAEWAPLDDVVTESSGKNPAHFTKSNGSWSWNSTVYGTEVKGKGNVKVGNAKINVSGNECYTNFHWYWNDNRVTMQYQRTIRIEHHLSNDWRTLLVGVEVGDKSEYGTPIALDTVLYGSYKQITPTETGMYFNEEVYSSWSKRMTPVRSDSLAKENYLLTYRNATTNYLYDYLTNFETYLPLDILSDADLVNRGKDSYRSIQANDQRAQAFTSAYSTHLQKYYEASSGWLHIIDNYNNKIPILDDLLTALVPSVTSNDVDSSVMAQYVAGLIETTVEYAPMWTVEYYNSIIDQKNAENSKWNFEHPTEPQKPMLSYICEDQSNYAAIQDALYLSLLASSTSDLTYRTVKLEHEDGTTADYTMLYYGYAALRCMYSSGSVTLNTNNVATDVTGFGSKTLTISSTKDDRLDMEKSLEYISIYFGKLLYKYGNVASATMAYFYGEQYWDKMLAKAAAEGVSTGPEWHNDDLELIDSALSALYGDKSNYSVNSNYKNEFPHVEYDDEELAKIYSAAVVDYTLSYVPNSEHRIYLIRNTTTSLGSVLNTIGSLADDTREFYEAISDGPIYVYVGYKYSDELIYTLDLTQINVVADRLEVDLGLLMAVLMNASEGNPVYGLGTSRKVDEYYVLTSVSEVKSSAPGGLFGIPDDYSNYSKTDRTERDLINTSTCQPVTGTNWKHINVSYTATKCIVNTSISGFTTYSTSSMGSIGDQAISTIDLEKLHQNAITGKDDNAETQFNEAKEKIMEYLARDSRYAESGSKSLTLTALRLKELYAKYENALDVLYVYYYGETAFTNIKNQAANQGYGNDWFAYLSNSILLANNEVLQTLAYYDAALSEQAGTDWFYKEDKLFDVNKNEDEEVREEWNESLKQNIIITTTYDGCTQQDDGAWKCRVTTITHIPSRSQWKLTSAGFSIGAFSLFGDTTEFNLYTQNKLGMQNSGVEVYERAGSSTRNDVDAVITATLATEDNFHLNNDDYSLFAFFSKFDDYLDETTKRAWFTPTNASGVPMYTLKNEGVVGQGTPNDYSQNAMWDFPILRQFVASPTGSKSIKIVEHFGDEKDPMNGGYKKNVGIVLEHDRGASVYSMFRGKVIASGYNPIYGQYVEVQADSSECNITIATTTGEKYQITGMRMIYGYLQSPEFGGTSWTVGSPVYQNTNLGKVGSTGRSQGRQLYVSMYVQCNILDMNDEVIGTIGWTPIDLEPYFTTQFTSNNYTVTYD